MIVVDLEMTGVDARKHSIVSIGAVDFKNPERQFYAECRIDDGAEIDPKGLEVNGFTEEQVKDKTKKSSLEIVKDFLLWCQECEEKTIAGQNVFFDRDFLKAVMDKNNIMWPFKHRVVELHSVCYAHMLMHGKNPPISDSISALNLDKEAKYAGLIEEPRPHNALTGAKFEAEVFSRILFGKNLLEEFKDFPVPEFLQNDHVPFKKDIKKYN